MASATSQAAEGMPGSGSQEGLVAVSSRAAFYKRTAGGHTRGYVAALLAVMVLLFVVLALSIALAIVALQYKNSKADVCSTTECIRAADNLMQSMDKSVDPCSDFYRFACGRWPERHPTPDSAISHDWFAEKAEMMARRVREFLKQESEDNDPLPVQQARRLYRSCIDVQRLDVLGLAPMQRALASVGLALPQPTTAPPNAFSLEETIAAARLLTGRELLLGLGVYPDPRDRTRNRVVISPPDQQSPLPVGSELDKREEHLRMRTLSAAVSQMGAADASSHTALAVSYVRYVARVMLYAYTWNSTRTETPTLRRGFLDMARSVQAVEAVMYRVHYIARVMLHAYTWNGTEKESPKLRRRCLKMATEVLQVEIIMHKLTHPAGGKPTFDPEEMTVDELQHLTDSTANDTIVASLDPRARCHGTVDASCRTGAIRWRPLLQRLFAGARNVTLELDGRDRVLLVNNWRYLRNLAALLAVVDRTVLQNYLWWVMVETLAPHLDRSMRDLKVSYLEEVTDSHTQPSRSLFCASAVNRMMGMAVSVAVANPHFHKGAGSKVAQMLEDVRASFAARVGRLGWMDARTKDATRHKVAAMMSFVGFPEWLLKPGALEEYYQGLVVDDLGYLKTLLRISELMMTTMIESLRSSEESGGWVTDPTDVNAFHTFQANAITVPIGILQFPFYDLGLEVLNYGAIGSILGHELTHGFDDQGRQFDKNGNLRQWWSNTTIAEYVNRTECFVQQYSGYLLDEINAKVDGRLTLGENIADNGGLREALDAYRLLEGRLNKPEPKLPGLEHYSQDQLFFLSFANVWCEAWTPSSLRYDVTNEHSPNHVRVRGVLENMDEFARAWRCPRGSPMNPPRDKCVIW